jgi:hypothetical protein
VTQRTWCNRSPPGTPAQVLAAASEGLARGALTQLGADQRVAAQGGLERVYQLLSQHAVPALEELVALDYSLRRVAPRPAASEQLPLDADIPESERVGNEKVCGILAQTWSLELKWHVSLLLKMAAEARTTLPSACAPRWRRWHVVMLSCFPRGG